MKILYAATRYSGEPQQGLSFEHYNFFESLLAMGHDLLYFDFVSLLRQRGRAAMNRRLAEVVRAEHPDLMFTVLLRDELDPAVVRSISTSTSTATLNWFCDDHWRFENFTRRWAPQFNWAVTTASSALPKYHALGYEHVLKSQWACNTTRYRPLDLPMLYDVTFVGAPHGDRRFVVDALRQAGIDVHVWGLGWGAGRINQENMIRVFSQSRINLNLSNASPSPNPASRVVDALMRLVQHSSAAPRLRESVAGRLAAVRHVVTRGAPRPAEQIKGRNFEIPGCRGFLLTGRADNLEQFYVPGREVACFGTTTELIDAVRHYLAAPEERVAIARAGYERTRHEHTYHQRFADIFARIGLPATAAGPTGREIVENIR